MGAWPSVWCRQWTRALAGDTYYIYSISTYIISRSKFNSDKPDDNLLFIVYIYIQTTRVLVFYSSVSFFLWNIVQAQTLTDACTLTSMNKRTQPNLYEHLQETGPVDSRALVSSSLITDHSWRVGASRSKGWSEMMVKRFFCNNRIGEVVLLLYVFETWQVFFKRKNTGINANILLNVYFCCLADENNNFSLEPIT